MEKPVAIVTGAGRGIGRAVAQALDRIGYRLALVSRTVAELKQTAKLLTAESLIAPADVSIADDVDALIRSTVERFGRIDAVIHCAGVAPVRSIAEMSPEEWREVIDTNLSAAFYLCHAAWPIFRKQEGGVVVLVSSQAARDPFAGFAAYGAAKAALNHLTLSLAREGQAINVRAHCIAPGAVETGMFRQILSEDQFSREKTLSPEDVASIIALCVRGDLRYASGEVIYLHKTV
jgi:NAD(P)-dependent dehydrogenase (short-subunit alcohol dehydrogenase family)